MSWDREEVVGKINFNINNHALGVQMLLVVAFRLQKHIRSVLMVPRSVLLLCLMCCSFCYLLILMFLMLCLCSTNGYLVC